MSLKLFAFLFVLFFVGALAAPYPTGETTTDSKCTPGTLIHDGCKVCYCHQSGFLGCSDYDCPKPGKA
ncbi:unnamed protein product [Xylocopa violacea]|uniref:Pacifastin domain-containing protein n=1 Tax=Xylocopa violacea TaxID=135666 RepID=A0ABP1PE61_XYLVO